MATCQIMSDMKKGGLQDSEYEDEDEDEDYDDEHDDDDSNCPCEGCVEHGENGKGGKEENDELP